MTVRVLALDIATQTGVCFDNPLAPDTPLFRTWELRTAAPSDFGVRYVDLAGRLGWLIGELAEAGAPLDIIAFEEPLLHKYRRGYGSGRNVRLLGGLAAIAEYAAAANRIRSLEVNISTAKTHFGGSAGGDKAPIIARCKQLGWPVRNDDEADAGSIWSYVKCTMDPKFSYQTTPLFGRP